MICRLICGRAGCNCCTCTCANGKRRGLAEKLAGDLGLYEPEILDL